MIIRYFFNKFCSESLPMLRTKTAHAQRLTASPIFRRKVMVPGQGLPRTLMLMGRHSKSLFAVAEESEVLQRLLDVRCLVRWTVIPAGTFLRRPP